MKMLVAHESRAVRKVLCSALASTPYASAPREELATGAELLRTLSDGFAPGTVILLDWNLPGLDVLTFLAHLEALGVLRQVSILLCVNPAERPLAVEAVRRGARGILVRPFSEEELAMGIAEAAYDLPTPAPRPEPQPAAPAVPDFHTTLLAQEDLPSLLSLPLDLMTQLFDSATRSHHEPGSEILRVGQMVDSLLFVTSGEVELDPGGVRGAAECFGERAFICGEPAAIAVRARTSVEVAAVPKEIMVELARGHQALQDFLTVLLTRPAPVASDAEIAGSLVSLSFDDLLQYLSGTRKTGTLALVQTGQRGRISFENGQVTDARAGGESGEAAFRAMAGWTDASFEFRSGAAPAVRTIFQSTLRLLLSARAAEPAELATKAG